MHVADVSENPQTYQRPAAHLWTVNFAYLSKSNWFEYAVSPACQNMELGTDMNWLSEGTLCDKKSILWGLYVKQIINAYVPDPTETWLY